METLNQHFKQEKIPVFYHVPKNAGTYFISVMILFLRLFRREKTNWLMFKHETIKNIEVFNDGKSVARILLGDPENLISRRYRTKDPAKVYHKVEFKKLDMQIISKCFVWGIIIEPDGFIDDQYFLDLFDQFNFDFKKSIILREPYARARSFYNYIVDDMSKHEWTHGLITGNNFEEYLESGYVEDSWVIRNICGIGNSTEIEDYHYDKTKAKLMQFFVVDISKTNKLLSKIFSICYNYNFEDLPPEWSINFTKNSSSKKYMTNFEDLPEHIQIKFSERVKFDRRLYLDHVS